MQRGILTAITCYKKKRYDNRQIYWMGIFLRVNVRRAHQRLHPRRAIATNETIETLLCHKSLMIESNREQIREEGRRGEKNPGCGASIALCDHRFLREPSERHEDPSAGWLEGIGRAPRHPRWIVGIRATYVSGTCGAYFSAIRLSLANTSKVWSEITSCAIGGIRRW